MGHAKLTFIHKEIHDYRQPIIVPKGFIKTLRAKKEISVEDKRKALQGEVIEVLGYRIACDKKIAVNTK